MCIRLIVNNSSGQSSYLNVAEETQQIRLNALSCITGQKLADFWSGNRLTNSKHRHIEITWWTKQLPRRMRMPVKSNWPMRMHWFMPWVTWHKRSPHRYASLPHACSQDFLSLEFSVSHCEELIQSLIFGWNAPNNWARFRVNNSLHVVSSCLWNILYRFVSFPVAEIEWTRLRWTAKKRRITRKSLLFLWIKHVSMLSFFYLSSLLQRIILA